jgi:hypothetical protein
MSAVEVIEHIKELPASERVQVARFITEPGNSATRREFSISTENDGLPVIRANGGIIASQLVRDIESQTLR